MARELGTGGARAGYPIGAKLTGRKLDVGDMLAGAGMGCVQGAAWGLLGGIVGEFLGPVLGRLVSGILGKLISDGAAEDAALAASRARTLHGALDPIAQEMRATAVLSTSGPDIVASGARDLAPVQRALLQDGEIEAREAGLHAEETVMVRAGQMRVTPRAIGVAGQPICPSCARMIEETGGTLISPFEAIWG